MKTTAKRRLSLALATTVATAAFLVAPGTSTTASAATANFRCTGISTDIAGSVAGANKSSKQLLDLLASIGGSPELALAVNVGVTVPSSVTTGSGAFNAKFDYNIALPDTLVTQLKSLLKLSELTITNASFAVNTSGAATGTIVGTTASKTVSLASSPVTISQPISGSVTPSGSGLIYYRPGASKFSVVINGDVAGAAKIGTITLECTASGLLGSTAVKPAGAPNIAKNPLSVAATAGETTSVALDDGVKVVADQGNPIQWDSLRLVNKPSGGTASVADGAVNYTAPAVNGTYDVTYEVCGASKTVVGDPGTTEIQTLSFSDSSYTDQPFNKHPMYFTLTFAGQETAPIITSVADFFGAPVPYDDANLDSVNFHRLFGKFQAPSAAKIQAALEGLSNIGPGDVIVTGGPTAADLKNPYTFTFAGALDKTDVGQIAVGKWVTWLPNEALAQILAAASGISTGTPTVTPPTFEASLNSFLSGAITFDQMLNQWGDRTKFEILAGIDVQSILDSVTALFPKTPTAGTTTEGEAAIPDSETGPLCSQAVLQFVVTGGTDPSIITTTTTTTKSVTTTTVKSSVRGTSTTNSPAATATPSSASYAG